MLNIKRDIDIHSSFKKRQAEDYYQFLLGVDDLIERVEKKYPNLQKPMLLIIGEYLRNLLDEMYNSKSDKSFQKAQTNFLDLITAIGEDLIQESYEPFKTMEEIGKNKTGYNRVDGPGHS